MEMAKGILRELERIAFETGLFADKFHMRREYKVGEYEQPVAARKVTLGNIFCQPDVIEQMRRYNRLTPEQQRMCIYKL